jgi:hypothetical protein
MCEKKTTFNMEIFAFMDFEYMKKVACSFSYFQQFSWSQSATNVGVEVKDLISPLNLECSKKEKPFMVIIS